MKTCSARRYLVESVIALVAEEDLLQEDFGGLVFDLLRLAYLLVEEKLVRVRVNGADDFVERLDELDGQFDEESVGIFFAAGDRHVRLCASERLVHGSIVLFL